VVEFEGSWGELMVGVEGDINDNSTIIISHNFIRTKQVEDPEVCYSTFGPLVKKIVQTFDK
jgi:hypothetical protein